MVTTAACTPHLSMHTTLCSHLTAWHSQHHRFLPAFPCAPALWCREEVRVHLASTNCQVHDFCWPQCLLLCQAKPMHPSAVEFTHCAPFDQPPRGKTGIVCSGAFLCACVLVMQCYAGLSCATLHGQMPRCLHCIALHCCSPDGCV